MSRHPNKYEEMFPEEFFAELERTPIAYFSSGPLEWHGPHNALGCDPLKGYYVCLRAAEIAGGIVMPPLFLGPAGTPSLSRAGLRQSKWRPQPGIFHSREVMEIVVEETFERIEQIGFRVCMCFGGHWPNEKMIQDLVDRLGAQVGRLKLWAGAELALVTDESLGYAMDHGSKGESSVLMAARTELVDISRFGTTLDGRIPDPSWGIATDTDPREASLELGRAYVGHISSNLARKAQELLQQARQEAK